MPPHRLFLQAAEATKAAGSAAEAVGKHAAGDAFTALLWLLVVVFGAVAGLLIYKLIWKDKPATAAEADALRTEFIRLEAAFAERKKNIDAERLQDKLKFESDLAAVATTLSKLADVADGLTTMTERVGWHGKEIERHDRDMKQLHDEIDRIRTDINTLYRAK